MHRPLPAVFALCASLATSCAYARLDGSTQPSRSFDSPELISGWDNYREATVDHPGDTALFVLRTGLQAFAARVALTRRAEYAVDAQYYIFHDDHTGRMLMLSLLDAADRGVRVRLLLDDLGSDGVDGLIAAANAHPNVEVRLFNARARGRWPWLAKTLDMIRRPLKINRRMHNKLLAVDGLAVVVGGRNIGNEYFDASPGVNFGDLDLMAIGPAAREAGESFDLYWNSSLTSRLDGWEHFARDAQDLAVLRRELESESMDEVAADYAQRIADTGFHELADRRALELVWAPTRAVADLPWKLVATGDEVEETMLIHRLGDSLPQAKHDLLIVSPYFVPRTSGAEQLRSRVEEGVRVRVLTNSLAATDVAIVHAGYKQYRKSLLAGGVELYELMPSGKPTVDAYERGLFGSKSASLHAKTYVVDERFVFVGSLNLDPRSIELNTELGLVVDSPELARQIIERAESAMRPDSSWRLTLSETGWPRWNGELDGRAVQLDNEPDTSWWGRFKLWWMGALPIEGQL